MANGRFVNPISAGVESFQRQAGQFFQSQAEVNLLRQRQEEDRRKEDRRLAIDIVRTGLTLEDPEERLGFIRSAFKTFGVTPSSDVESALPSLVSNKKFLQSVTRNEKMVDLILGQGREQALGEIGALPAATGVDPGEEQATAMSFRRDLERAGPFVAPTPRAAMAAEEFRGLGGRDPSEALRKEAREIVTPPASVEEQRRRLGAAPVGGKTEETVTIDEQGRPKVTRKTTTGPSREALNMAGLALRATSTGPEAEQAKKALDLLKSRDSQSARATTSILAFQATSDDPKTRDRATRALAILRGMTSQAAIASRVRAFDRTVEQTKSEFLIDPPSQEEIRDPAKRAAFERRRKERFRQVFRQILEEFFLAGIPGAMGIPGEAPAAAELSAMTSEDLFNKANEGDEMAVEELIRRGEL